MGLWLLSYIPWGFRSCLLGLGFMGLALSCAGGINLRLLVKSLGFFRLFKAWGGEWQ